MQRKLFWLTKYRVSLRIQSEFGEMRTRITLNTDTSDSVNYGGITSSNKTQALTKNMNMDIWVIGKLRDSFTQIKLSRKYN